MAQLASFRWWPFLSCNGFAVGVTHYQDHYPSEAGTSRIVISVTPEGGDMIQAVVDTGAPWCILDPELADAWGLVPEDAYKPEYSLSIRRTSYQGSVVTIPIEIHAAIGQNLAVSAAIFIPTLHPSETWNIPNFLGLNGLLERIRFAVDATENAFYFGPAGN